MPLVLASNALIDATNGNLTFTEIISGVSYGLTLAGSNVVILSADNTYNGATIISMGILKLQGSLANSDITVQNGATLEIDGTITVKSINVEAGGLVKINNSYDLTVSDAFTLNSTSLLSSSLILDGSVTGDITYNRWVNQVGTTSTRGNDLVSPPVSGELWGDFLTDNGIGGTEALAGNGVPYNTSTAFAFGPYNKSTGLFENYTTSTDVNLEITSGVGYRAATTSGGTLIFTGVVASSPVEIAINDTDSKWNLIGNPFPSYLKADDFFDTNSGLLDPLAIFIYGYNGNPSGNLYTMIGPDDGYMVAPGQSFFVASNSTGGTVQFKTVLPDMRSPAIGGNDFITARGFNTNNEIVLEVLKQEDSFSTEINFNSNSSRGVDPGYDGVIFGDVAPEFSIYTQLVQDNTGRNLAIQSLASTDMDNVIVPLGINTSQGEQLTVRIANSDLPSNINVYLEDNLTNTWTLLNTGDYILTPTTTLSGTGRFFVHFTTGTLSVDNNILTGLLIYSDNSSRSVLIKGQLNAGTRASIYDLQGRQVIYQELNEDLNTQAIPVNNLSSGLYIVELISNNQIRTKKVIIN